MSQPPKAHREPRSAALARRSFLKAVGGAATALPFYKLLENSVAHAESGQLPLRFVGVGAVHGTTQKFYSRQPGEPLGADTAIGNIGYPDSCLRPFDQADKYGHSFKDKINIFEAFDYGVGRYCCYDYGGTIGSREIDFNMHGAMGLFLTGCTPSVVTNGMHYPLTSASLDQYLAKLYGGATKFRSVELSTEDHGVQWTAFSLAAGEGGALLSTMKSPAAIWDKFFATAMTPGDAAAAAVAAHRRAVGSSILDFAIGDLQRLQVRLASTEKQKLEQHLTVVRDLERQLAASTMPPAATCTAPVRHAPSGNANPADNYLIGSTGNAAIVDLDRVCNMQIDLLAQILICDLTRFATLVLPNFGGPITGSPLTPSLKPNTTAMVTASTVTDIPVPADFHLEIAHLTDSAANWNNTSLALNRAVAAVQRYYHGKVARLMQRLQDAGVLDSTVILIGNEGGAGWHTLRHVPIVMCGGANGALRMGRRIVAPGRVARAGDYPVLTNGAGSTSSLVTATSHNPILVAVANVFRAAAGDPPIDRFGTCPFNPQYTLGIQGLV